MKLRRPSLPELISYTALLLLVFFGRLVFSNEVTAILIIGDAVIYTTVMWYQRKKQSEKRKALLKELKDSVNAPYLRR